MLNKAGLALVTSLTLSGCNMNPPMKPEEIKRIESLGITVNYSKWTQIEKQNMIDAVIYMNDRCQKIDWVLTGMISKQLKGENMHASIECKIWPYVFKIEDNESRLWNNYWYSPAYSRLVDYPHFVTTATSNPSVFATSCSWYIGEILSIKWDYRDYSFCKIWNSSYSHLPHPQFDPNPNFEKLEEITLESTSH